jgi:hypothetical protein
VADLTPAREAANVLLDVLAALDPTGDLDANVDAVNLAVAGLPATGSVRTSGAGDLVLVDTRQLVTGVLVLGSELLRRASAECDRDRDEVIADVRASLAQGW